MLKTVRAEKVDKKNGVICLVSIVPSWVMVVKTVKIIISDQIAFVAVVYFGQVFGFCRLINKSVLKWFLLIMVSTKMVSTNNV